MLILTGTNVGLISVSLGVIRAMEHKGVRLSVFRPIAQPRTGGDAFDQATAIARANSSITTAAEPLRMSYVEGLLSSNQKDVLMEKIVANYRTNTKGAEVIPVKGLVPTRKRQFAQSPNYEVAKTLNAETAFVMSQGTDTPEQPKERTELTRNSFGGTKNTNIIGVIVNKLNTPADEQGRTRPDLSEIFDDSSKVRVNNVDLVKLQESGPLPVLGAVPWSFNLIVTRTIDMARHLNAAIINGGDINTRRVKSITFCACSIPHMLEHLRVDSLLTTSTDRPDVSVTVCLTAMNGVEVGTLLLTGSYRMDTHISKLCERAFAIGLSVFMVSTSTWQTSLSLRSFNPEVPASDHERIEKVQEYVANCINVYWIESLTTTSGRSCRLSPSMFRYQLAELARKASKHIVLSEGDEPCTVRAVATCAERDIATCTLLGNPAKINRVTVSQGVELGAGIEVVDPEVVRESYVDRLVELHRNRGTTETAARGQLEDNMVLGTLTLRWDEVDGLVSDVVHTTTNTTHPPLQLIKTTLGNSLVSSVLFTLLPEQVYVYSDCATNPDPTAEQLAEIAIQSADSATTSGIEPRVAMLSYSIGAPGADNDIEKAREAAHLTQERRPDLTIGGPLQYDAMVVVDVARSRVLNFPVAGRATVFVFLDLNAGNAIYEAARHSIDLISIGPMLQSMRKPVNDLSRGALADDIVYTIALAAVQSAQQQ